MWGISGGEIYFTCQIGRIRLGFIVVCVWFGIITIVPFLIYRNPCTGAEMQESFNDCVNEHVMRKIYLAVNIVVVVSGEG